MSNRKRINHMKYGILLGKIRWFFETEDAMHTVRMLMYRGKITLNTFRELSQWAGDVESELRREVADNDKNMESS